MQVDQESNQPTAQPEVVPQDPPALPLLKNTSPAAKNLSREEAMKRLKFNLKPGKKVSKNNLIDWEEGDELVSAEEEGLEIITHSNNPQPPPPDKSLKDKKKESRKEKRKAYAQKQKEQRQAASEVKVQQVSSQQREVMDQNLITTMCQMSSALADVSKRLGIPVDHRFLAQPQPQASTSRNPHPHPYHTQGRGRGTWRGRGRGRGQEKPAEESKKT